MRRSRIFFVVLIAAGTSLPANASDADGVPAGASQQQRKFCATVLAWNEEVSRRLRAVDRTHKLIDAKSSGSPEAASDAGLAELFASLGTTYAFNAWTGRAVLGANGESAGIVLHACDLNNSVTGEKIEVRLSGGGIPVKSPLAERMAGMNPVKEVVVSGFFVVRTWPNHLVQFNMRPRDIRHPEFDIRLTSIAQAP